MKYTELKIEVNRDALEQVEAVLIEAGCDSMMIDDPEDVRDILDHPDAYKYDYIDQQLTEDLGRRPVITLFFDDSEDGRAQQEAVIALMAGFAQDAAWSVTQTGDDSEWLYKWQEHFKPTRIGKWIVVKPSWEDYAPEEGDLVIEMDPGMAFGSGLHETTSMCIEALEEILSDGGETSGGETSGEECAGKDGFAGAKVLDVGCGTGILAIAAALLGAEDCLGTDIDPDAVEIAAANIRHNGLEGRVRAVYGDLTEGVSYKADIITANLMADLVVRLSGSAAAHLNEGGKYITSGILDIREEEVSKAIRAAGFRIDKVLAKGEWRAIIATLDFDAGLTANV